MKDIGIKEQIYLIVGTVLWAFHYITSESKEGALSASLAFGAIWLISLGISGWMISRSRGKSGD
jgi:hypothetical protein